MFFVFAAMAYWGLLVSLRAASCTRAVGVRLIGYFSSKGSAKSGIPALFGCSVGVRVAIRWAAPRGRLQEAFQG